MIGNDVVDLLAASGQSNWRRKGFFEKVFSKEEQATILFATDQNLLVWLLWSMKEAAYKAHQRQFKLPRTLNWLRQECKITSLHRHSASGIVEIGEHSYYTSSDLRSQAIHTSAGIQKNMSVKNALFEGSSEIAKTQLLNLIGERFSLNKKHLSCKKNPQGVPYITYRNQLFFSQFSFSGHGRFSAFSMSLIIS